MKHVIVGSGVAGVTAAQGIVRADPSAEVHVFGAEPYPYYRRPLLWEFIAGQLEQDALYFRASDWYAGRGINLRTGVQVAVLTSSDHCLTLVDGETVLYERLLLATGARPFIPPCEGTDKEGVFTLRTLDDALAIKAYMQKVSTAVVIGGGLLGLETARALQTAGLDVTVVEFFPYLLPRQLDAEGAQVLQSLLEAQGLHVLCESATEAVLGDKRADYIRLKDKRVVNAGLVLFSTGIRSEVTLAQAAGLEVNHGIVVDEQLRVRRADGRPISDIFAVGDAAEFEGRVYGIIPPAIEQARVAAANMVAPGSATYTGTLPSTTLKVAGAELTSLGECLVEADSEHAEDEYTQLRHVDLLAGYYSKLVLHEGHIVGAILLNDKERVRPVAQLIKQGVDVSAYANRLLDDDFDLKSLLL
ncbi:MAG TPA: NAD(P)/FAD-dependent oxidoreductase [Anaerolineae bacterium]|nr:NAD(P)/FAD-dependent oxidoreductase [Anaerolineae bacterium]